MIGHGAEQQILVLGAAAGDLETKLASASCNAAAANNALRAVENHACKFYFQDI